MSVPTSISGFPRIGRNRELKKIIEAYWKGAASLDDVRHVGRELRAEGIFEGCRVARIEQSMEDVFVYLVKSHAHDDLGAGRISGIGSATAANAKAAKEEAKK